MGGLHHLSARILDVSNSLGMVAVSAGAVRVGACYTAIALSSQNFSPRRCGVIRVISGLSFASSS